MRVKPAPGLLLSSPGDGVLFSSLETDALIWPVLDLSTSTSIDSRFGLSTLTGCKPCTVGDILPRLFRRTSPSLNLSACGACRGLPFAPASEQRRVRARS